MKKALLLLSLLLSYSVYAQPATIQSISAAEIESEYLTQYRDSPNYSLAKKNDMKKMWRKYVPPYVKFMRVPSSAIITPTKQEIANYNKYIDNFSQGITKWLPIPEHPLDQGQFGTCVTFAILGQTEAANLYTQAWRDHVFPISPSCTLQIQRVIWPNFNPWDGSSDPGAVWYALNTYGAIPSSVGDTGFCNPQFPTYDPVKYPQEAGSSLSIPLNVYKQRSVNPTLFRGTKAVEYYDPTTALNTIINGMFTRGAETYYSAFTFSVAYPIHEVTWQGTVYPVFQNTGELAEVESKPQGKDLHEIYLYGIAPSLCVPNSSECGMLMLRNSWGDAYGANGVFFMTYAYFLSHVYRGNYAGMSSVYMHPQHGK